jgi:drug efflux transport system permease protein
MISPRRLKALIIKEFLQIVRDPSSIMIAFILPLILLFIFGYGISLDTDKIRVGLVTEETSSEIQSLVASFLSTKYLDATVGTDRRQFEQDILSGRLRGMIVIPQGFTKDLDNGENQASIQVIADGTEPNTAAFVQNYSQGVLNVWLNVRGQEKGLQKRNLVEIQPRFWYNPELESRNFLIPGSIAIVMTLIGILLTALVIAREWERGTMEALLGSPVRVIEMLLGKLVPYFLLGMGSMVVCFLIAVFFYKVPFRGSFGALALVSSFFLFAALGQGLLISTLGKNQFVASQAALISGYLPAFLLSGFIFEISSMPAWIQAITYLFAARYLVTTLQTLFLTGDIWVVILPNCLAMFLIGAVFFIAVAMKTSRRVA